jgi:outer membrane protein assembly factor BamD (BamD/ComL family)
MFKNFSNLILSLFIIVIAITITGCSTNKGKEEYEAASKKNTEKKFNEAAAEFEKIIQDEPKSEYAAKSMLQLAGMYTSHLLPNMKRADDYQKAYQYYSKVLNDFRDSPEGGKACLEIGKYYQSMLDANLPKDQSMKKAIDYYRTVINKYSGIEEAESAMFMIAFIQANEINQPDSAKDSYESFIKKYPNSKLIVSAKSELQILGKKPEDILRMNEETKK